jgi:hypothetical protein
MEKYWIECENRSQFIKPLKRNVKKQCHKFMNVGFWNKMNQ